MISFSCPRSSAPSVPTGIVETIGSTPLMKLNRYFERSEMRAYAKLESFNPGGSAKDRPARQMIEHAMKTGKIGSGSLVVESSSGNMGIGLAQVCRYYGMRFHCVVDRFAQSKNVAIMAALGATVDRIDHAPNGNFLQARLDRVQWLLDHHADSFWPNQYANLQNPRAHSIGTIEEIHEALGDQIDYVFVATSSTGTARGCRDYLRKYGFATKVVAVDAEGSALFGGTSKCRRIPGLGAAHVPPLAQGQMFDDVVRVSDIDCVRGCRRMASREAVLVGGSSGGVLEVVRRMQDQLAGKTCVAILHDSGTRYLDTVFSDEWVQNALGCSRDEIAAFSSNEFGGASLTTKSRLPKVEGLVAE